jgi:hypothetical protein
MYQQEQLMNAKKLVVMAVLLSASMMSNAQTLEEAVDPAPGEAVQSVTVVGKAEYKLAPQEFSSYEYTYTLTSGEKIVFTRRINRYYGRIAGKNTDGPLLELSPLQAGKFATADGALIEFQEEGEAVLVTNPQLMRTPPIAAR